ncbi:MAG: capsular biosynthesis protein, partial [Fibrobacter sp.]|nr:capsular biosynthesis protein [Fibrobacter sp.]
MEINSSTNTTQNKKSAANSNEIDLLEILGILLKHKLFLFICIIFGCVAGFLVSNYITPKYTSDALLQIDVQGGKAGKAMGEMGALLDVASPAEAEIELLKSRMILSHVVEEERLCYNAYPIGIIDRLLHQQGRMDLDELHIPEIAIDKKWKAKVVSENEYVVISPEETVLARGIVGEPLYAPYMGDTLRILVKRMMATPDQMFNLVESDPLSAVKELSEKISVGEKGKKTGIIGISYIHRYPDRAASVLNAIANKYLRQNV